MTPSNMKEKIGEKGETVTSPLTTGAGTIFCMQLFSLKYYTVLQNIAVVQRGCLRCFARIIKKNMYKKKEQGEKGDVP